MIVFPESHVDLTGSITFTRQQLIKRWDQELARKWSEPVQTNLRDFMQIKASLDPLTFPNYAANDALLSAFMVPPRRNAPLSCPSAPSGPLRN